MITREFRPQKFEEVAGQDLNKRVFKAIIDNPEQAPKSIILQGAFGTGKCVLGTTRVFTHNGYKMIKDLYPNAKEGFSEYTDEVLTRYGTAPSSHFYKQSSCDVNLMYLESGYVINGTDLHRVLAYHNNTIDLHPLKDLTTKDYILFPKDSIGENWKEDTVFARVLAFIVCCGFIDSEKVYIVSNNKLYCLLFLLLADWCDDIIVTESGQYQISHKRDASRICQAFEKWCNDLEVVEDIYSLGLQSRYDFVNTILALCEVPENSEGFTFRTNKLGLVCALQEIYLTLGEILVINEVCVTNYLEYEISVQHSKNVIGEANFGLTDQLMKENRYRAVQIKDNIRINYDVYDLTVPVLHEFYAQGTFNHNTTMARIFSKALNCEAKTGKPCGVCASCKEDINSSPYYSEYDSAAMGSVENIRDLRDTFAYRITSGWTVNVFDESHTLSVAAQSALLKIIEEAPPRVFFLFATTNIEKVIKTIRSRSLELRFDPIPHDKVVQNIKLITEKLGKPVPEDILSLIAKKSKGHMRNAHMLLDKYFMLGNEDFQSSMRSSHQAFYNYFIAIARKDKAACCKAIDEILTYPLAELFDDYQEVVLSLAQTMVGLNTSGEAVVSILKADTAKVVKAAMAGWLLDSFNSDINLQTALLCLFQMLSQALVGGATPASTNGIYNRAMARR